MSASKGHINQISYITEKYILNKKKITFYNTIYYDTLCFDSTNMETNNTHYMMLIYEFILNNIINETIFENCRQNKINFYLYLNKTLIIEQFKIVYHYAKYTFCVQIIINNKFDINKLCELFKPRTHIYYNSNSFNNKNLYIKFFNKITNNKIEDNIFNKFQFTLYKTENSEYCIQLCNKQYTGISLQKFYIHN